MSDATLSVENFDKLNEYGLYKIDQYGLFAFRCIKENYNNTYDAFMRFDINEIRVTNDNIDEFQFMFTYGDIKMVSSSSWDDYDENDRYLFETDVSWSPYWIKRNAKKSATKVLKRLKAGVEDAKLKLEMAENELNMFLSQSNC